MDLHSAFAWLAVGASTTVGAFLIGVVLDDVAGVVRSIRRPERFGAFDWNKLPSFLRSQFGTVEALALLGMVVAAVTTAVGSALLHGGLSSAALQGIADAAMGAATLGAGTMLLSVVADLVAKVGDILGSPLPAPAPELPVPPPAVLPSPPAPPPTP